MDLVEALVLSDNDVLCPFLAKGIMFPSRSILTPVLMLLEREEHSKALYMENWINRYIEYDFFMLFRMSKATFKDLVKITQCPQLCKVYKGGGLPVPVETSVLITLWWLGKGDTLISISDRFIVAASTAYTYCDIVIKRLVELLTSYYVVWPNAAEMVTIEQQFYEICGFPGKDVFFKL